MAVSPRPAPAPGLDVATLCDGDYALGVAALLNSLVTAGFRGDLHVGHRGPLPSWLDGRGPGVPHGVAPGVRLVAWPLPGGRHVTQAKAAFLASVLDRSDAAVGLAYADADVVVRQDWDFVVDWTRDAVAVCADHNPVFPRSHPTRRAWRRLAAELGETVGGELDLYANAGFVGVSRPAHARGFLADWDRWTAAMAERGPGALSGPEVAAGVGRHSPFQVPDQDALNLALMRHEDLVSMVGPQGMGFAPGWRVLAHSTGAVKPWRRRPVVDALRGVPVDDAERAFLAHAAGPVRRVLPARRLALHRAAARLDGAVGRLRRR